VEVHQGAHNTLLDLNEPVPETKKVTNFLASITDPRLSNAKDLILGDAQRLQDFESCQQYLKTLIYNKTTQEKHERQVSGVRRGKQSSYKGRCLNTPNKDTSGKTDGVTARTYTQEEWSALTDEEQAKVKHLRKERKSNRPGKRGSNDTRNASATTQVGGQKESDNESYHHGSVNPASETSDSEDDHVSNTSLTRRMVRSVIGKWN
jgi:hypothetical protein